MSQSVNEYEVIGKGTVERGGSHIQYALKLLYRGDGTPWWTCSAGLEWPTTKEMFDSVEVGDRLTVTVERNPKP